MCAAQFEGINFGAEQSKEFSRARVAIISVTNTKGTAASVCLCAEKQKFSPTEAGINSMVRYRIFSYSICRAPVGFFSINKKVFYFFSTETKIGSSSSVKRTEGRNNRYGNRSRGEMFRFFYYFAGTFRNEKCHEWGLVLPGKNAARQQSNHNIIFPRSAEKTFISDVMWHFRSFSSRMVFSSSPFVSIMILFNLLFFSSCHHAPFPFDVKLFC